MPASTIDSDATSEKSGPSIVRLWRGIQVACTNHTKIWGALGSFWSGRQGWRQGKSLQSTLLECRERSGMHCRFAVLRPLRYTLVTEHGLREA